MFNYLQSGKKFILRADCPFSIPSINLISLPRRTGQGGGISCRASLQAVGGNSCFLRLGKERPLLGGFFKQPRDATIQNLHKLILCL